MNKTPTRCRDLLLWGSIFDNRIPASYVVCLSDLKLDIRRRDALETSILENYLLAKFNQHLFTQNLYFYVTFSKNETNYS